MAISSNMKTSRPVQPAVRPVSERPAMSRTPPPASQPRSTGFSDASSFDRRSGNGAASTTPLWSQGDARWGSRQLGNGSSVGRAGCAMTATAMAAAQISGRQINPGELDARLDRSGGYSGNALNWGVAARQYGLGVQQTDIRNRAGMDQVNRQLDAGRPVVLGVDYRAGANGGANGTDHWITLTGRSRDAQGRSTYTANDPNGGRRITLTEQNGRLVEQNPPAGRRPYQSSGPARTFTGGTGNPAGNTQTPRSTTQNGDGFEPGRAGAGLTGSADATGRAAGTRRPNTQTRGVQVDRAGNPPPATTGGARANDLSGFRSNQYDAQINEAARRHGVPPRLLKALIEQESQFNPNARSRAGAQGLTQLMPGTARELGVRDPNNPTEAINGGARYLAQQLRAFGGNERLALAAYNAGAGNVRRHGGVPPFRETQNYVRNIMARYEGRTAPN